MVPPPLAGGGWGEGPLPAFKCQTPPIIQPIACSRHATPSSCSARRSETLLCVVILGLLILISVVDTEFYPSRIITGLPRIGEYFGKLFSVEPPAVRLRYRCSLGDHLFGASSNRNPSPTGSTASTSTPTLLWQTIQMAILATVMGFTCASRCRFPPRGLWCATPAVVWITRRLLEVMRSDPAGRAGFHPGLAVWDRPAGGHPRHRHPHHRSPGQAVFGS